MEDPPEDDGTDKEGDLDPVHPIKDVVEADLEELEELHSQSDNTKYDNDHSSCIEECFSRTAQICVCVCARV